MPAEQVTTAIETLRKSASSRDYGDQLVLDDLDSVAAFNERGESYCGNASALMLEFLPAYFEKNGIEGAVFSATSAVRNGCFHMFNIVRIKDEAPLICDLSSAQFFTRPMDLFSGKPYFVGTREELKALVRAAQNNTWDAVQKHFPDENFRSLWDIDLRIAQDREGFAKSFYKMLEAEGRPCLQTESLYYPWEITWGDRSQLRAKPDSLSATFDVEASVSGLIRGFTPPLDNLVNLSSARNLTLADGPR
jgi:hypothetical protein